MEMGTCNQIVSYTLHQLTFIEASTDMTSGIERNFQTPNETRNGDPADLKTQLLLSRDLPVAGTTNTNLSTTLSDPFGIVP